MAKTAVVNEIEQAFIETPLRKKINKVKTRHDPLQGVSSWKLLREIFSRHFVDIQITAFWILLALIIWVKLSK